MARAPFQVLVIPYRITDVGQVLYAAFRRRDGDYWQWIAGGGESNETPLQAAKREAYEEARINTGSSFTSLTSMSMIPVPSICGSLIWGEDVLVVPEHCFGVEVTDKQLYLSNEHTEYEWVCYEDAYDRLQWDSNRTALWEIHHRLTTSGPTIPPKPPERDV